MERNKGRIKKFINFLIFISENEYSKFNKKVKFKRYSKNSGAVILSNLIGYAKDTIQIKEVNKPKNAIVIIASPKADYNNGFKYFSDEIEKVKDAGYNVFVDTVSNKEEYFDAFRKGANSLDGKFDLYFGAAHGKPKYITLGRERKIDEDTASTKDYIKNKLKSYDLQKVDLSCYFNSEARGIQFSCSVADTSVGECFVQLLSNSLGIPIEAPTVKSSMPKLSKDLHIKYSRIESLFYMNSIKKEGFNSEGKGNFRSENGIYYPLLKNEKGEISVEWGDINSLSIPQDFDTSNVYHFRYNNIVREVRPQK